jgi:hypothetical protein
MGPAVGEGIGNLSGKIIGRALPHQRSIVNETINEQLGELSSLRI